MCGRLFVALRGEVSHTDGFRHLAESMGLTYRPVHLAVRLMGWKRGEQPWLFGRNRSATRSDRLPAVVPLIRKPCAQKP
jgi:hypothetical protein